MLLWLCCCLLFYNIISIHCQAFHSFIHSLSYSSPDICCRFFVVVSKPDFVSWCFCGCWWFYGMRMMMMMVMLPRLMFQLFIATEVIWFYVCCVGCVCVAFRIRYVDVMWYYFVAIRLCYKYFVSISFFFMYLKQQL